MTTKTNIRKDVADFIKQLKDYAITVGEECPEGHRRHPGSGACLPIGPTDHTAFTRSLNDDQGDAWRGLKDKPEAAADNKEAALLDASDMDEPISCGTGTTFSFIQRKCVSLEEAEAEDNEAFARDEQGNEILEEVAQGGHEDVVAKDPEGRRDPVGFQCPPSQFFDFKRRECIPLNKDTVLASESVDAEFKKLIASYLSGRLAVTSPDPLDGHTHLVTVDAEGNGKTSVTSSYSGDKSHYHSHDVSEYEVKDYTEGDFTSRHFGHLIPKDMWEWKEEWREEEKKYAQPAAPQTVCCSEENVDSAAELRSKQRKALPDSAFGVPGKRKFPLDTCNRVRNAMARFNQAKGLTPGEKATLRRKIMSRAKACGVKVTQFGKANTTEEFANSLREIMLQERIVEQYVVEEKKETSRGNTCPPGMEWDMKSMKCVKMKAFYEIIKSQANHSEIISKDPEGRRDTVGFQCPPGFFFDFKNRKCLALDPSRKEGTSTSKASTEDAAKRDLAPSPKGRPARLPQDCPEGTIWDKDLEDCKPLDSRKKTKSAEENANLTPAPAGKVRHPSDCPAGTMWDGARKTCTPMDTMDKNRPSGNSPQSPKSTASAVDTMSTAQLIKHLDELISSEISAGRKEKAKVAAKDLPNEAFPPSLVGSTRRSLMHHSPEVKDSYDNETVDVSRLRNALARVEKVEGYAAKAVEDAEAHLVYHAREVVKAHLGKN